MSNTTQENRKQKCPALPAVQTGQLWLDKNADAPRHGDEGTHMDVSGAV